MGRSGIDEMDDWELAGPATGVTTLVLVGRTGNGKSATGNSILGRRAFKSRSRSSAVTLTSELQQFQMNDGRILNVVDTPEEAAAVESLQMLFGDKILNYMVVIFTGGDELEENQETLEDYLHDSPLELQELLRQCDNRKVLFNNKATSKTMLAKQVTELLKQTDIIIAQNGGHPYSNELFREAQERKNQQEDIESGGYSKEEMQHLKKQIENAYAEQLKQLTEMVEEKLRITTEKLEQRLSSEQAAREQAEKRAQKEQEVAGVKISMLLEKLQKAEEETENLKKQMGGGNKCVIL